MHAHQQPSLAATLAMAALLMSGVSGCSEPAAVPPLPPSPECTEDSECTAGMMCVNASCVDALEDITEPSESGDDVIEDITDAPQNGEDAADSSPDDTEETFDAPLPDIDIAPPPGECVHHIHCAGLKLCSEEGDCLEPPLCLNDGDCLEERVCDRGKCAATHAGCNSVDDCIDNGICDLLLHECVDKSSCQDASDCVDTRVCVDGACAECLEATDCPNPGLSCIDHQCREADPCDESTDCFPGNSCEGGVCMEPVLLPDALEENDSPQAAGTIEPGALLTDLTVQSWEEDWFVVTPSEQQGLLARIVFDSTHGNLDLAIFDASGEHLLEQDDRDLSFAMVSAPTRGAPETYLLRVTQPTGAVASYSLETFGVPKPFCANDSGEGIAGNDGPETATIMESAEFMVEGRRICPGDQDWFEITLEAENSTLGAVLEYVNSLGGLDVRLFDSTVTPLSTVADTSSYEFAVAQNLPSGTYYVAIDGEEVNTANSYKVSSLFFPAGACLFDTYEWNDNPINAPWFEGSYNQLALCAGDVDWYATDVPAGKGLISSIEYNNVQSQLKIDVLTADDFTLVGSDPGVLAPAGNQSQSALLESSAIAQTVLTRVTRMSPAEFASFTPYSLNIEVVDAFCSDDDFEENDTPGTATEAKTLFGVKNEGKSCPEDSDWYSVELSEGDVLTIDLAQAGGALLGLHVFGADASTPVGVDTTVFQDIGSTLTLDTNTLPEFTAGIHYILVTGGAPVAYSLTTFIASPDSLCDLGEDTEPNDTWFTSAPLGLEDAPATGHFCPNNPDVFHFQGGESPEIELTVATPLDNPKVVVSWASPELDASQGWILGAGGGTITLPASEDGLHFISLHSPVASEYTVSLTSP